MFFRSKIIRINSGLGNQMYQYSFILNFKLKGEIVKLDLLTYQKNRDHNGFELQKIFNIKDDILTKKERFKILEPVFFYKKLDLHFLKIIRAFLKKILSRKINIFFSFVRENETIEEFCFNNKYLNINKNKIYFEGYFQSYKYFDHIKDKVLEVFTFPEIIKEDKNNFKILEKIKNTESVSIHIRRGDYLKIDNFNICDLEYYKKSFLLLIEKLKERNIEKENINFFIFSDDIAWCMENLDFLKEYKVDFIDWNKKENSYKDMQLMSECKHNIIPNSTFSWWGAYLNKNINKIVIAPKYWFKEVKTTEDRCPKDWFLV